MEQIIFDGVFVLAAVAFFKERTGLRGWYAIGAAFVASLLVVFLPELAGLFPNSAATVEKVITVVKLFLTVPGLYDLVNAPKG